MTQEESEKAVDDAIAKIYQAENINSQQFYTDEMIPLFLAYLEAEAVAYESQDGYWHEYADVVRSVASRLAQQSQRNTEGR